MSSFAFVFPGQGSQSVGMLDAWGDHPVVRQTLDEASQILDADVAGLIRSGPKEQLDLTANTQPVMLAAGIACFRAWIAETGLLPAAAAGHSLGEYTALVAAGSLSFADALPLVRLRGQAMQAAVPVGAGAMAAVLGLDARAVIAACAEVAEATGEVVEAANFNDPRQTVIAGSRVGVDRACEKMKALGAKRTVPLSVSAPFHCRLMQPAADRLRERLLEVRIERPKLPVVNNIDAGVVSEPDAIRDALYRQAYGAVRWVDVVRALVALPVSTLVECGPGRVLVGLSRRIDAGVTSAALYDPASMAELKGLLT
jgi:[acyl-carrier-protein] S-malonyltransferase